MNKKNLILQQYLLDAVSLHFSSPELLLLAFVRYALFDAQK